MKKTSLLFLLSYFFLSVTHAQMDKQLLNFGQGANSKGKPSLAISGNKAYILYTSANNMGKICTYDLLTNESEWSGELFPTIGATDASHNNAAMAIDGSGYIHVWIGMHNHRMKYWRSNSPRDIHNFTDCSAQMPWYDHSGIDEKRYTYPTTTTASNGDVFVILRRTALFMKGGVVREAEHDEKQDLYHWNNKKKTWTADLLLKQEGKNAYMSKLYADNKNNIHIVTAWSQLHHGNNTYQRGTYLRYDNNIGSYSKADGKVVTIPAGVDINPADVFFPGEKAWNDTICEIQTPQVVVNGAGKPIITVPINTNFSPYKPKFELNIIRFDGKIWVRQKNVLSDLKNYEHPPLASSSKRVSIYARNTSAYVLKSADNGATFPTNEKLKSGGEPVDVINLDATTDIYITFSSLFKVVY